MPPAQTLCFGSYRLMSPDGPLLKDADERKPLPRRELRVLWELASRPDHVITKQDLIKIVWKRTHVHECSLARAISDIRHALDANYRKPHYIKTVHRSGYQFIAPVTKVPTSSPPRTSPSPPSGDPPFCNIPSNLLNPYFVGRESLLENVREALIDGQRVALSGLGGVGKTQLALAYAHKYQSEYKKAVLWVRADEPADLAANYAGLANCLQLPVHDDTRDAPLHAVQQWLDDEKDWLLILDNVSERPTALRQYLPRHSRTRGHVLITSRNPNWREIGFTPISVPRLERQESINFLIKRTGQKDPIGANAVAEKVGDLPLALELACALMEQAGILFSKFLCDFKDDPREFLNSKWLKPEEGETIARIWRMSFQQVQSVLPEALDLLHLCAFLAPHDINREPLLSGGKALPDGLSAVVANAMKFDHIIAILRAHSLVEREITVAGQGTENISVHPLLQTVIQKAELSQDAGRSWVCLLATKKQIDELQVDKLQVDKLIVLARKYRDALLFWCGKLTQDDLYEKQELTLADPDAPQELWFEPPDTALLLALFADSFMLWLRGFPDQALAKSDEATNHAEKSPQFLSQANILMAASVLRYFCGKPELVRQTAETLILLTTQHGFRRPHAHANILSGWALAMDKCAEEQIQQIKEGLQEWDRTGTELGRPFHLTLLAEAYMKMNRSSDALEAINEALSIIERTGECWWEAEVYRLRGELRLQVEYGGQEASLSAEEDFQQALNIAHRQQAKSLELRAAMSLSRLWQQQGKCDAAREVLAPIYGWFIEGFDTADLRDARALLE